MFGKVSEKYDKEKQKPVIRVSICTGEKVAGFVDIKSGKFTDVMLIKTDKDMKEFCKDYGVDSEKIEKIW